MSRSCLALAAFLLLPAAAFAQHDSLPLEEVYGDPASISLTEGVDAMYDYELYLAKPDSAEAYYLEYAYEDGTYWYSNAFLTEADAKKFRDWMDWRGIDPGANDWVDPDNLFTTSIFLGYKEPDWRYHDTYGTRAEAEAAAADFAELGLLTEIRSVSTLTRGAAKSYSLR